jgi:hypothetical protein
VEVGDGEGLGDGEGEGDGVGVGVVFTVIVTVFEEGEVTGVEALSVTLQATECEPDEAV